tara:strand:+ start:351 stop:632 length:282 start_codon:yes stop_codon:yes gene_type:complete
MIIDRQELSDRIWELFKPDKTKGQGSIGKIVHYVEADNYLQILYTYGIETIKALLGLFLEYEDYETCALIRDTVEKHNKATGKNYKLTDDSNS